MAFSTPRGLEAYATIPGLSQESLLLKWKGRGREVREGGRVTGSVGDGNVCTGKVRTSRAQPQTDDSAP